MKKKYSILFIASIIAWASCTKEQLPSGLVLKDPVGTTDTNYLITTIPIAQTKTILLEDATGVHCANCPLGAHDIENLKTQYPNRIISVSVYSPFLNDKRPGSLYDFNTTDAADLVTFLNGGDPSKPTATINRLETGVATVPYFFTQTNWPSKVASIITSTTPINLELTSTPTANANEYLVKSKITCTSPVSGDLGISLYLIENHVVDLQDSAGINIVDYVHHDVLRKIITPIPGAAILSSFVTKETGRVAEKGLLFTLPSNVLNKANCKIVGFVHHMGASKEVLQTVEIDL